MRFVVPEREIPVPAVKREAMFLYSKAVAPLLTPRIWFAEPRVERPIPQ